MPETPDWPSYPVGPIDSINAIGVVSANYTRLESVLIDIFTAITGCSLVFASFLLPKILNNVRIDLMNQMLEFNHWPQGERDRTEHFIEAFSIITDNRNRLMHSGLFATSQNTTTLHKTTKKGNVEIFRTDAATLRRVADEMMVYAKFGSHLATMLHGNLLLMPRAGDVVYDAWPDKPPPPFRLKYSSNPIRNQ